MKTIGKLFFAGVFLVIGMTAMTGCSKKTGAAPAPPVTPPKTDSTPVVQLPTDVSFWLTKTDQTALLKQQNVSLLFSSSSNGNPTIVVDTTKVYQSIDGFGYALTGGSATLINRLPSAQRAALVNELFGTDSASIGVSYLRISMGASDLSAAVFSYDDNASPAQPDTTLQYFSLSDDAFDLVPLLKQILTVNPSIKILATPWSAPIWMKTNDASEGGSLLPQYYDVYAQYFVKYIQAMKAAGIPIDAITPQNEPLNAYNNPSMVMPATDEETFVKDHLGPAFQAAGLSTKIIVYDHNCDQPSYPLTILADPAAQQYVDGSAFHLYAGDISALTQVHNAYPSKNVYFTEQWVGGPGDFPSDLDWGVGTLVIGAPRNWSRNVLEWNLANDPNYDPHTPGGCSTCLGALTISPSNSVSRNVSYYMIGHASKFVRPGSVRVDSNVPGNMQNVAFVRPDGKKVLIVLNNGTSSQTFNIQFNGRTVSPTLDAGAVGTFIW